MRVAVHEGSSYFVDTHGRQSEIYLTQLRRPVENVRVAAQPIESYTCFCQLSFNGKARLTEKRRGETRYATVEAGVIKKKRKKESERGREGVCVRVCVLCSKRVNVRSNKKTLPPPSTTKKPPNASPLYIYIYISRGSGYTVSRSSREKIDRLFPCF